MNSLSIRGSGLVAALLAGVLALVSVTPGSAKAVPQNNKNKPVTSSPAPAPASTTYSGHANALRIDDVDVPVPGPIILADTGQLSASGGVLEASESNYQLLGADGVTVALGVDLAYATTAGDGPEATADGNLTAFEVRMNAAPGIVEILADYVGGSASASVAANGNVSTTASASVENLRVNGAVVAISGAVNQTVVFPGGHLVINEQTTTNTGGTVGIKVVALHVFIDGCMNGSFGVAEAGIAAGSTPPPPDDHACGKLTGGGWIPGPSGGKATFGISGGIRRGEFWGHLEYVDHDTGLKVKSTRVTNYIPNPNVPDCRIISYDVEINGLPGTATVDAWDRGEPGRNDFFSIKLSTGYSARGTLGGDGPGGGNLQLHKCPPGWDK